MENIAPVTPRQHPTAKQRRKHWREAVNHHHDAHELSRRQSLSRISHDGTRQHRTNRTGETHHETRKNQQLNIRRETTRHRRNKADDHTEQQRLTAARLIRQRTHNQLAERHTHHERAQRQRCVRAGGVQVLSDCGQCRQVHIRGERCDSGQQRQNNNEKGREPE